MQNLIHRNNFLVLIFITVIIFAYSGKSIAARCKFQIDGSSPSKKYILPFSARDITAGADINTGTVLSTVRYNKPIQIQCEPTSGAPSDEEITIKYYLQVLTTPYPSSGMIAANGLPVYNTPISGIGFALDSANPVATPTYPALMDVQTIAANISDVRYIFGTNALLMRLYKTGAPGSGAINGEDLPTLKTFITTESNYDPVPKQEDMAFISFSGVMNVVSYTCRTPDVVVSLGEHETNIFTTPGTSTQWVDSSIQLLDCPTNYFGYTDKGTFISDSGVITGTPPLTPNKYTIELSPKYGVKDAATGIININSGTGMASGVGIQVASGNSITNTPAKFNIATEMTPESNTSQKIPLVARLIQTDTNVTPGKIESVITFTINYY
ncbi:type 1 fimbrial protein [Escherichia coli]|uniref:fimbrial protein n=1 Tax=Escherichia coli TaxID=562 RepID=UPI000B7E5092|nr:fimbrial protein [Escherichia coli]EJH5276001.1 type 1 fimbrial protein [Escherichia coli O145:H28]EEU9837645.1 type 1 fimbrial protein [Escherichia coli]EEV0896036.1 type 1 fimbrial protein [Escherichia coli]EFC7347751.1 type 1 fimbrial protein [Escherichia coli]EFO1732245.1 type 1 fimbrial protein [Escherichia coli]